MKIFLYFPFLIIVSSFFLSCSPKNTARSSISENHPLIGTWILVSSNNTNAEGEYFILDRSNTRQIKILNPTHWMFIQERINNGEREFVSAAGGRYETDENHYVELIDYASWENYPEIKTDFTWRLDNGRWYHTGILYTDSGDRFLIEEIWEKVD